MGGEYEKYDVMMMANKMEQMRGGIKLRKKLISISFIVLVLCWILLPAIVSVLQLPAIIITLIPFAAIVVILIPFFGTKSEKEYKRIFKTEFVPRVLKECFDNVYYDENSGFTKPHVEVMNIIETGNRYRTEDFISADYNGVHFQRADVYSAHHTQSGKNSHTTVYFNGRIYQVMFNKKLTCAVQIVSKNFNYSAMPIYLNPKQNKVVMENDTFNSKFNVYAGTQQDAFYVLTPHMMESILRISKHFNSMCILVVGNRLILAGNSSLNGLEAQIEHKVEFETEKARIKEELREITDIIDDLKLDNRSFIY